jgi:phage shock protein E
MFGIFKNLFFPTDSTELKKIISEGAFLVDVRSRGEFSSGHVSGSVNVPLDQLRSQLAKFKDKNKIVVFCQSGMRSSQAKILLEQNGFQNVVNGGTWLKINQLK